MRRTMWVMAVAVAMLGVGAGAGGGPDAGAVAGVAPGGGPAKSAATTAKTAAGAAATTSPTSAPIDQTTPRGTLKLLAKALEAGDRKMLLEVFDTSSPSEKKLADATAALAEATAELRRASVKAFGEQASRPLGIEAAGEAMARVDASIEKIDGDKATVTSPVDPSDSLLLVQRDKKWRVPMAQFSGGAVDAADLEKNLHDTAEQAKLLKAVAVEVTAGKFKTAMDARQELDKRIIQSAMPQGAAATVPAVK